MKKFTQFLVFAFLFGAILVSCKKKEDVVPCFDAAYKGITYVNAGNDRSIKIESVDCKTVVFKDFSISGTMNITATVTGGTAGAYTMNNPLFGDFSVAISATSLNIGGGITFSGTKK